MALVKGPNGVVHDIEDRVAASLVGRGNRGYEYVDGDSGSEAPAQSDNKAAWVDYAVSQGADRDEAESMTKAELIDQYGA